MHRLHDDLAAPRNEDVRCRHGPRPSGHGRLARIHAARSRCPHPIRTLDTVYATPRARPVGNSCRECVATKHAQRVARDADRRQREAELVSRYGT